MSDPAPSNTAATLDLYRSMRRIRHFEERVIELFKAGEFSGFLHTGIGQEAIAAGVVSRLRQSDYVTSTHRGHGHVLAKGVSMDALLAEIYGKVEGPNGGVAGHVHVTDLSQGLLGGNGVLGQNQPIAVGLALAKRLQGKDDVVVTFFGDGTANEGAVHEAMNLAGVWQLPVLFLCERNEWAELSPYTAHTRAASIADRAQGYGFKGYSVDGTDVEAVAALTDEIVANMRRGGGPALLETRVVRWHGHYEGDPQAYRDGMAPSADPLDVLTQRYPALLDAETRARIDAEAEAEMAEAVTFARAGHYPEPADLFGADHF